MFRFFVCYLFWRHHLPAVWTFFQSRCRQLHLILRDNWLRACWELCFSRATTIHWMEIHLNKAARNKWFYAKQQSVQVKNVNITICHFPQYCNYFLHSDCYRRVAAGGNFMKILFQGMIFEQFEELYNTLCKILQYKRLYPASSRL